MSNETLSERVLYNNKISEEWLELVDNAPEFNRFDLTNISALLVAPCDLGTLVIRDGQPSLSKKNTLKTLDSFFKTHRFFDYSLTKRCFKSIKEFPSYKVPFVNWHYALFPLERPKNCMWLNPLDIYDLKTIHGRCFAELSNGLVLETPTQMRSIIDQAEKAIYVLCYLRREYSLTDHYNGDPLDYVQLPQTPFLKSIRNRSLLQHWVTERGVFHQRYLHESLLQYSSKYLDTADVL